jgi:prepilin-type processing-associated H-X9-DG protein
MPRTLLGCAAAVAAVALVVAPRPTPAQPPADQPLSAELKLVPGDAAVFAHVDVERVWKSKLGETFRKVNARDINEGLKFLKENAGITPDDVKTFTFFIPKIKTDGEPPVNVLVTTRKPYDRDKLIAFIKKDAPKDRMVEKQKHVYVIEDRVTLDMSDPMRFRFATLPRQQAGEPAATGDGPVTPAIKAAAAGKPAVLAVAFGNLPDEIRQENIPAEVRPFQPFFFSDSGILTADFVKDEIVFDVRFKNSNRARAVEAEKSLGALKTLILTALEFGIKEVEKGKDQDLNRIALTDFMKQVQTAVKAARITNEENTPAATLTAKADLDFAPVLQELFGKTGMARDRMMDANNLKQIGLAMHNYLDTYQAFPPSALVGRKGKPMLSWRVMILPYIEQDALYKKFKLDEPWDSAHNKKVFDENPMPRVYLAPGGTAKADEKKTHYQGFVGNGAFFDLIQGAKVGDLRDGFSNTLMVVTAKTPVPWSKPDDVEFDPKKDPRDLLLFVNDVCNVGFADGSVRAISKKTPADTWRAVITRAGGETIDLP